MSIRFFICLIIIVVSRYLENEEDFSIVWQFPYEWKFFLLWDEVNSNSPRNWSKCQVSNSSTNVIGSTSLSLVRGRPTLIVPPRASNWERIKTSSVEPGARGPWTRIFGDNAAVTIVDLKSTMRRLWSLNIVKYLLIIVWMCWCGLSKWKEQKVLNKLDHSWLVLFD